MNKKRSAPLTARMRDHKSPQAVVNMRFYVLFGSIVLCAVLGVFSTLAWVTNSPPAPDLLAAQPQGKAVAELTANAFVTGATLPVPLSSSVTSGNTEISVGNGKRLPVRDLVWVGFTPGIIENIAFERHDFELTVLRDSRNPQNGVDRLSLQIVVLLPKLGPPVLGALPYLSAVEPVAERPAFDYGGTLSLPGLPPAVEVRLQDWATYWAADDRARLQATTPDGDTTVEYIGLGGFVSERAVVLAGVPLDTGDWLIRARVDLIGPGEFGTQVDLDITVTDVNTASPRIIAWGPAGSGVLGLGHNSVKRP